MKRVKFKDASEAELAKILILNYCARKRLSCRVVVKENTIGFIGHGDTQAEAYTQGIADGMTEERLSQ